MSKMIKINNFKCFIAAEIKLSTLTLFTGINGAGKSSVIQAYLLFRKSIEKCSNWLSDGYLMLNNWDRNNIALNNEYCLALGTNVNIVNKHSKGEEIIIELNDDLDSLKIKYPIDSREQVFHVTPQMVENENPSPLSFWRKKEFYYLNAERIGPRIASKMVHQSFLNVGCRGEFSAQVLGEREGFYKIGDNRKFKDKKSNNLEDQANYWIQYILDQDDIKVSSKSFIEAQYTQIKIENIYIAGEPTNSTNIGFGISYVLPIIITCLIAVKDSLIIIENPEAHLHPKAQSRLGVFLCFMASTGSNIIVETHSDHIIHGVQIGVVGKSIRSDQVIINFFNQNKEKMEPDILPINISDKGELNEWPRGFFDQTQMDYAELFRMRKNA